MTTYWINSLPITHDIEEAQMQYEFLSEFILNDPEFILGANPIAASQQCAKILGEALEEKYFSEKNKKLIAEAVRYFIARAPPPVQQAFNAKCQNVLS